MKDLITDPAELAMLKADIEEAIKTLPMSDETYSQFCTLRTLCTLQERINELSERIARLEQ